MRKNISCCLLSTAHCTYCFVCYNNLLLTASYEPCTMYITAAMVVAVDSTDGNMEKKSLKGKINRESATR